MRKRIAIFAATLAALALAAPASAPAAPVLEVDATHYPPSVAQGTNARYEIAISNVGTTATNSLVTVDFEVPAGLEVTSVGSESIFGFFDAWTCSSPNSQSGTCSGPEFFGFPLEVSPGQEACVLEFSIPCHLVIMVRADANAPLGTANPTIEACGGGAASCDGDSDPIEIVPAGFSVSSFDGEVLKENGDPATQAGSHPRIATTEFFFSHVMDKAGYTWPAEDLKDTVVEVPPGLVGNPQALATCTEAELLGVGCAPESQVATIRLWTDGFQVVPGDPPQPMTLPVYNMVAPHGQPAVFGFQFVHVAVHIFPSIRTGEDYGLTVTTKNAAEGLPFEGIHFTFWGVPADPSHDSERRGTGCDPSNGCESEDSDEPKPFLSLPTSCVGPVETFIELISWLGHSSSSSFLSHAPGEPSNLIGAEGCNAVPFVPSIEARPTTNVADSPSGLDVNLHVPQSDEDPNGIATAHLRDTTITLPEGLVINPSGANGLDGCSLSEFGYTSTDPDGTVHTTAAPATCPNASKLGTVEVDSPLVDHLLEGTVHIADPYQNPFDSLLALYITVDDRQTGTVVKLAGEVKADPQTGRLSSTFQRSPQLPFEDFELHFFGGAGGSLRTPAACGTHTATSELVPWTAPEGLPATPSDSWQIVQGPGGACATSAAALPHSPSFDAGTVSPIAGAHSPFVVNLRRADGTQNFHSLSLTPPPGLVAKLAGTAICPDSALDAAAQRKGNEEKANPSCPAAAAVGTAVAFAGAGPAPYPASGTAYLTGPYKGAPLSISIVTPAVAGPFDLGTVVVRSAVYVDSKTAQITAVSDPIPSILQGIPLDVRTVQIALDKPNFSLNPTSCDPMAVSGSLLSTLGQIAPLESRFQLGECGRLGFKPSLTLSLKGGTTRGKHPALTAILTPRPGDANIASLSVALPSSEFLDQANIGTVCTRVQFAADACPAGSVYGTATVTSPIIDYPLSANVYLRSSDNKLPDLVPAFKGPPHQPIELEAAGRTDTLKGGLRNSFALVPDVPFSRLVLQLQGGPDKGLLINSRNICQKAYRALVNATAHNGKQVTLRPKLRANCKDKTRKRKAKASLGAVR
jgi:hypothetical protein